MLRVTLEIVPFGIEERKRHIGTIEIARTTACENPETYTYHKYKEDGELETQGHIADHWYQDGAWKLLRRALTLIA